MTALVVQAHPLEGSFNAAMRDQIVDGLTTSTAAPRVIRIGHGEPLSAASFDQVTAAVFVYPTWWGSLPAMLLAALGDVISPWVDGDEPVATSPLRTVERVTVVTSHGSSKFINLLQGEPGLQLWKRTVLPLCAPAATFTWKSLYKLDRISETERRDFLDQLT